MVVLGVVRKVTSIRLKREIWRDFRIFCITNGMKISEAVEDALQQYMVHAHINARSKNVFCNTNKKILKLEQLKNTIIELGYENEITRKMLEQIIIKYIGSDKRTIRKYIHLLLQTNFIEIKHVSRNTIYKINPLMRVVDV